MSMNIFEGKVEFHVHWTGGITTTTLPVHRLLILRIALNCEEQRDFLFYILTLLWTLT